MRAADSVCDLCGSEVGDVQPDEVAIDDARSDGSFCNECGWENPSGSNFCSECGSRLQAGRASSPVTATPPPEQPAAAQPATEGIGKQVALLVGGAVLVVLALYMVTLVSKQNVSTGGAQAALPPSPASLLEEQDLPQLSAEVGARVEELRATIGRTSGAARREAQGQLVDALFEAGRADLAAVEAQHIAEETGHEQDWRDAGDLYFQWMESSDTQYRADLAHLTMFAYERVLEENPDNHDVRANVAWAAQYDASDPMRAIEETNYVLERDPDHVQANFNRGYFLMRINRFDQAVTQMERVLELAGEGTPVAEQASMLIQIIREEEARSESGR